MITNFENITADLTEVELALVPLIIKGFSQYTKENPIKEPEIVRRFNERSQGMKLTGVKLRKLVNHIRVNSLLPLIATSRGYYVSYDPKEIEAQVKSLHERASSIKNCAQGLHRLII
jgi:hypothetical protein